jgi:4-azaleucine resistance transporter AzlC
VKSSRSELLAGIRAQLPILLGTTPFGMIYGINAINAGLPLEVVLGMSMFVFAGSAQFIAARLFETGAVGIVIVMTTFVVNLRHMLYSASVAPYVRHLAPLWKYVLAFLLTDEAYAVTITHYRKEDVSQTGNQHWFFLGAGLTLWVSWQISTLVGALLGRQFPESWSLDFTLALTFIALVIPTFTDYPPIIAALSAGIVALAANGLPYNLGLIIAVLGGITAGVISERLKLRSQAVASSS